MNDPIQKLLVRKPNCGVLCVDVDASIRFAADLMATREVGALIVMDGGEPVGLLSERDIISRVVAAGLDANVTPVEDAVTWSPITIDPATTVEEAIKLVSTTGRRHLVVVEDQRLVGVISARDLMSWLVREQEFQISDLLGYITGRA